MGDQCEDWSVPGHQSPERVRGSQIVTEQVGLDRLSPEENGIQEILYQTVIDCYKIATGQWKHFVCMRWHHSQDAERILKTARTKVVGWIESEAFVDYVMVLGWNPEAALAGIRKVLNGECNDQIAELLKSIGKQPNEDAHNRSRRESND